MDGPNTGRGGNHRDHRDEQGDQRSPHANMVRVVQDHIFSSVPFLRAADLARR